MKLFLILAALALAPAFAQVASYEPKFAGIAQIKPQAVPLSTTTVTERDAALTGLIISNNSAGALTVTVADRQASPVSLMTTVSIAANTVYVLSFPFGYYMPSGFTIIGSGTGLIYYAQWKQ